MRREEPYKWKKRKNKKKWKKNFESKKKSINSLQREKPSSTTENLSGIIAIFCRNFSISTSKFLLKELAQFTFVIVLMESSSLSILSIFNSLSLSLSTSMFPLQFSENIGRQLQLHHSLKLDFSSFLQVKVSSMAPFQSTVWMMRRWPLISTKLWKISIDLTNQF